MPDVAGLLSPALHPYRGTITDPERWASWRPRPGDILVSTPSKCGTTWTQAILTMLVNGGPDLPEPMNRLSPWIDADLGISADTMAERLDAQPGRRVVKTHTPGDGCPVWGGVTVITVYRHPLDVFFSFRKHAANRTTIAEDHPLKGPVQPAIDLYLSEEASRSASDLDSLANLTLHYRETGLSSRFPDLHRFHYSDMRRDGRDAVERLAKAARIDADAALIDTVAEATSFGAMKAKASDYVPAGGMGLWMSDQGFFDSANSNKWEGQLSDETLTLYRSRLRELVPDPEARRWLEAGNG